MRRDVLPWPWLGILLVASALAGCDYSAPESEETLTGAWEGPKGADAIAPAPGANAPGAEAAPEEARTGGNPIILENVVKLIQTAALKPGGDNFRIATENLNDYFENTQARDYVLSGVARAFLATRLPEDALKGFEDRAFTIRDARHIEDCMLYHDIATRVGGTGEELARVRRLFDWMVRQVQLVPAESLAAPGLGQAYARPYDVLVRGMAVEEGGYWSERGWLFLSLCRQLGIDAGMLSYTPPDLKEPVVWLCGVRIDRQIYLFDPRIGLPVPGPGGVGVATLDDALNDPMVLAALDLPGQAPYGTTREALAQSPTKITVLLDSSPGYVSPRMRLLQSALVGKNRTILYRDPVEQRDRFVAALGPHSGGVSLWMLPITVATLSFTNPNFVQSTQHSLALFDPRYPLNLARIKQLRGDLDGAIESYIGFRYAENAIATDGKTPLPSIIQQALDQYATYYLGLAHLERNNLKQAEFFLGETLRLLPAAGRGQPYFHMYRWGAQANLGRINQARGDSARAIAYYAEHDPTAQRIGNLLLARDLVWIDPTAPPPLPLPPPPPATP